MHLKNFIHVQSRQFVFAYVPKVACTNWKSIFRYLEGQPNHLNPRLAHDREAGGLTYLNTVPAEQQQALLNDPAVPKYTCVRNPYSRALSAYLNKIERYNHADALGRAEPHFSQIHAKMISWHAKHGRTIQTVSFADFLAFIEGAPQHPWARDEHWVPQHEILSPTEVTYDYIGRFESLEADAAELLRRMDCDIAFPTQEAIRFPSSGTANKVALHYTPACVDLVQRIYARDFEQLGYDPQQAPI